MSKVMNQKNDEILMTAWGLFMLHEKYHTLNQIKFTNTIDEKIEMVDGYLVADKLKQKNQNLPLYGAFILLVLTKNLKFMYVNLDQVILANEITEIQSMKIFDKIYGQQSFIVTSKLVPVGNKVLPYLNCLSEFRLTYVQKELDSTFQKDEILKNYLGIKTQNKAKVISSELISNVEIQCSLSVNIN